MKRSYLKPTEPLLSKSVPVTASFPLEQAPAAYERFSAGKKLGKIVLDV